MSQWSKRRKTKDIQDSELLGSPTSREGGQRLLCSVLDELRLGLTKKDNYIMWVSGSRINIFVGKMASQVTGLHWRGHLNIIIAYRMLVTSLLSYCGTKRHILKTHTLLVCAQPVSPIITAAMFCMLEK